MEHENNMGMREAQVFGLIYEDCKIPIKNMVGRRGDVCRIMIDSMFRCRAEMRSLSVGLAQ